VPNLFWNFSVKLAYKWVEKEKEKEASGRISGSANKISERGLSVGLEQLPRSRVLIERVCGNNFHPELEIAETCVSTGDLPLCVCIAFLFGAAWDPACMSLACLARRADFVGANACALSTTHWLALHAT
jgi:hypothetical protein